MLNILVGVVAGAGHGQRQLTEATVSSGTSARERYTAP